MYSELWIEKYGESYIYDKLRNKCVIDILSHNEEDVRFSFAIENYLVKHRNSNDRYIVHYIDKLFKLFSKNPLLYAHSYILSNDLIVKSLINNNEERKNLYITGKKKLVNGWKNTYNKLLNDEPVNIDDKNRLIVLLTLGTRNGKNMDIVDKYVFKLLGENKVPDNDYEKLLLFNYASRKTLGTDYNMVDTFIKLGNLESSSGFIGGYENDGFIVLNDHPSIRSFYKTLDEMIQTCCHETTHAIQEQQAINDSTSVHAMEMAIQKIFAFNEYKIGDNYLFNEIEEDAERNGYWNARLLYSMAERHDISTELMKKERAYIEGRKFQYEYVTVIENGHEKVMSKEKYNVENIRRIVKNNKDLINKYPVLNNIFDKEGNPKSLDKMLSEDFKSHDIRGMYTDFIIYDIRNNGLDNIDLTNKDENYKYNTLNNLCNIYRIFADKAGDIIRDYGSRELESSKTKAIYRRSLEDIITVGKFIEKELPFMRKYEEKHPGNYNLYSSYTMDLRNLLNTIDKYRYENKLTNIEEITDRYKEEFNSFDINMRKEYINYVLERFTFEERVTLLRINGHHITLEEYIRTKLFNHISRDHYLYDNNGKILMDNNRVSISPSHYAREILKKYRVTELDDMFKESNKKEILSENKVL